MAGKLSEVLFTLQNATEVYLQEEPGGIYLYSLKMNGYTICVVARHLNGDGFIATAFMTTKSKRRGTLIWRK